MGATEWVIIDCPGCTEKLKVSRPSSGEVMRCPECNHLFEVPEFEEAKEAVAVKVSVAVRADDSQAPEQHDRDGEPANTPPSESGLKDLLIQDYAASASSLELGELEPESKTPILFSDPDTHRADKSNPAKRVEIKPSTARTPSLSGEFFEHFVAPSGASKTSSSGTGSEPDAFDEFKARIRSAEQAKDQQSARGERRRVWKYRHNEESEEDVAGDYDQPEWARSSKPEPASSAPPPAATASATATAPKPASASPPSPATESKSSSSSSSGSAARKPSAKSSASAVTPSVKDQSTGSSQSPKSIRFSHNSKSSRPHWERFRNAWILGGVIGLVLLVFLIRSLFEMAGKAATENNNSRAEQNSAIRSAKIKPESALPEEISSPSIFIKSVRPLLENFLGAVSIEERLKYVRSPVDARPRMIGFYKRNPEMDKAVVIDDIKESLGANGEFRILTLSTGDGIYRTLWLEKQKDGTFLVDWESWVEYCDMEWEQFTKEKPTEGQLFYVKLKLREENTYYAYDFDNPRTHRCWRVDFLRAGQNAFAYTPKVGSEIDPALIEDMERQFAQSYNLDIFVRVKLAYPENPKTENQLIITDYVGKNWVDDLGTK